MSVLGLAAFLGGWRCWTAAVPSDPDNEFITDSISAKFARSA